VSASIHLTYISTHFAHAEGVFDHHAHAVFGSTQVELNCVLSNAVGLEMILLVESDLKYTQTFSRSDQVHIESSLKRGIDHVNANSAG
jgi:hypothetical protein